MVVHCYEPRALSESITLLKEKSRYNVYEVLLDAGDDNGEAQIELELYTPNEPGAAPLVLMLTILNGQTDLMRPFATHFVKHGYAVVIVGTVQRRTLLQDIENPEPAIRTSVERHRRIIDWAETRPDIDTTRLGVFGASLGGFNALLLAALDGRVDVVSPALTGGSLASVLVSSDERRIFAAMEEAKEVLSKDRAQLLQHLEDRIETDPLAVAPHMNANRVFMMMASRDTSVPYESQVRLWEAMGQPKAIIFPTGHVTTAAYLFYMRKRIRQFFDEVLADPGQGGTAILPDGVCEASET